MSYDDFESRVFALIRKAGGGIAVMCYNDEDRGLYHAFSSDGTHITANSISSRVTVNFGSGHRAMATI